MHRHDQDGYKHFDKAKCTIDALGIIGFDSVAFFVIG